MKMLLCELLESFLSEWDIALTHINIKPIQNAQIQSELKNPNVHISQIDFAMSYT